MSHPPADTTHTHTHTHTQTHTDTHPSQCPVCERRRRPPGRLPLPPATLHCPAPPRPLHCGAAGPPPHRGRPHRPLLVPGLQPPDRGDWTCEEQFKQLYELDADPKRKEFLDALFSFMQKGGTPVNRIPIVAKQVLDLFMLYVLVTEKAGLVEVINKKPCREITKGLNLPTPITSLPSRCECEKHGLSNPNELQAAIQCNWREGRRQSFGGSLFAYSPAGAHSMLSSPKLPVSSLGLATSTSGSSITPAPEIKKEEDAAIPITVPGCLPVFLAASLEQLQGKLEYGEPPEKKMALVAEEQQQLMQWALQQNFLAMTAQLPMSIRINNQASESCQDSAANLTSTTSSNSISKSVEINGIMYTGVLFSQPQASTPCSAPSKVGGGSRLRPGSGAICEALGWQSCWCDGLACGLLSVTVEHLLCFKLSVMFRFIFMPAVSNYLIIPAINLVNLPWLLQSKLWLHFSRKLNC
uniref:AT-rich interactive domain-containing protein 3 n=1 Tax=Moschus moschiferus TaxID=68415 RepID=A0A8C6DW22_MOSMO